MEDEILFKRLFNNTVKAFIQSFGTEPDAEELKSLKEIVIVQMAFLKATKKD